MPARLVKFSLPPEVWDHFAARAAAHEQTVNEYLRTKVIDSLTAKQPAKTGSLRSSQVEPRWKQRDKPKATT